MPAAARVGDTALTGHPGSITTTIASSPNVKVFIQALPAAVAGSILAPHLGPGTSPGGFLPHLPPPIVVGGSTKVLLGGFPALRVGDSADLGVIMAGSFKVLIGG